MGFELYKSVDIDGERYVIQKFPAIVGLQIARLVITKATPLISVLEQEEITDEAVEKVLEVFGSISDEDISELVTKCLRFCYKVLPAGNQAIIDKAGNYGVDGIEYDLKKTVRLCYECIAWGASDFFAENGLGSLKIPGLM